MNRSRIRVTVLMGGSSSEREVSLRSGRAVSDALRKLGYLVIEQDPSVSGIRPDPSTDIVFLALHGTYGEDGQAQEELERLGFVYTGSAPAASRLAFDKLLAKEQFIKDSVPTPRYVCITKDKREWPSSINPPFVLKPCRQGSSIGLRFVDRREVWEESLNYCFGFDDRLIVEEKIIGREATVAILDGKPLPVVEVRPKSGVYDYSSKYTAGATEYICPAMFLPEVTARIQEVGLQAFNSLGCRDYARVDVMVQADGNVFVLEVNTLPGMTETSLFPKAAKAAGMSYEYLCDCIVRLALKRSNNSNKKNELVM